ncbi:MAG: TonB-dependent receptor [Rhodoferax sp.]|nr:TonB-dependent receptor [Rhodoferax sp.]
MKMQHRVPNKRILTTALLLALANPVLAQVATTGATDATTDAAKKKAEANKEIDQQQVEQVLDSVVVKGIKGSLMTSQDIRKESDVIVDSVTAIDMQSLPDKSIAEVLQRIPGVSISRFAGANDPDHFSAEGSTALVRGLNFVRSELNGRDIFTVDQGQGLGFNAVSPELMAGVSVFKTQSADMIEGGIGGTVDLITRKPLDVQGQNFAYSIQGSYGDQAEEWTPGISALYSNNWELASGGRFGLQVSGSYNEIKATSYGTLVAEWLPRDAEGHIIPAGAGIRTQEFDRERTGVSLAAQWESADKAHLTTFEFFTTHFDNSWGEYVIEPGIDDGPVISPRPGTQFEFDNNGLFQSGILSSQRGWTGNDDRFSNSGVKNITQRRKQDNSSTTTDYSLNHVWKINDQWTTSFDLQYVSSELDIYDIAVMGAIYADVFLDMKGGVPKVKYLPPTGSPDGYVQDPHNQYIRSIMDHETSNEGDEWAFRADAQYDFDGGGWAKDIKFGVRFSDRQQTVLRSTYNWGNVSDTWNNPFFMDDPSLPAGLIKPYDFKHFGLDGMPLYQGPMDQESLKLLTQLAGNGGWRPLYERDGVISGTSYLPGERYETQLTTDAFYVRFDFASDFDNGTSLDGNVGMRYVTSDVTASGGIVYPNFQDFLGGDTLAERCTPTVPGQNLPGFCDEDPATQAAYAAWADGSSSLINDSFSYGNWLPSLNLRWGFHDDMALRFAYAKAISRPDFGLLKSFFVISMGGDDPITGEWLGPTSDSAQVRIKPIESTQFDVAWEWYFAPVGSITVTGFYKDLSNYIVPGVINRDFTNNDETFGVEVSGSTNSPTGGGTISGVEFAYQQTFNMLPGAWSGLGVQANYTYINSNGVPNVGANNGAGDGVGSIPNIDVTDLGLPGLSEDTVNFVLFWESEQISTRVAYNYRSEYTLTTRDVIYPFTPIVQAPTSTVDFSFFYTFNKNFVVGFEAANLTGEVVETRSVYNQDLDQAGRSYFDSDTRYTITLRGSF